MQVIDEQHKQTFPLLKKFKENVKKIIANYYFFKENIQYIYLFLDSY